MRLVLIAAFMSGLMGCSAAEDVDPSVHRMCEALKTQATPMDKAVFEEILCPGSKGLLAEIISQEDRLVFAGIYEANADKPFPDFIRELQRNTMYKSKIQCFQALMIYGTDNNELLDQCKAL